MLQKISVVVSLPLYELFLAAFGCTLFGLFVGYLIRSWFGRAEPSVFQTAARVCIGVPFVLLYMGCVVLGMCDHSYSMPWPLHGFFGSIILTLFPKQILRMGKNGYEFGFATPPDRHDTPDHGPDDKHPDEKPDSES